MKISKVLLAVLLAMAFLISMSVASYAQTLDFTTGSLPSGVTMTGGAGTSYYDSSKVLHVANAANHPRFDHNPSSGAVLGILIEPANENAKYVTDPIAHTDTADLDHPGLGNFIASNTGAWCGVWGDMYPADAKGPDNVTNSAGTFVEDTTLSNATIGHHSGNNVQPTGMFPLLSQSIVFSSFVKRGVGSRNLTTFIIDGNGVNGIFLTVDLGTGVVQSTSTQGTGWTLTSASSQAVNISGNLWWRLTLIGTVDGSNNGPNRSNWSTLDSTYNDVYQGDGTSSIQVYGLQVSPASTTTLADSYIQNSSMSAVAHSTADSVSFTIPSGIVSLTYTFDDNSTQTVSVSPGAFTINPSTLNRPWIKTVVMNSGSSAPNPPTGLNATPGNNQVALSWTASSGATSYNVDRSTTSGSGYTTISSPTATNYTDTSVTNGTTYYYVVTATNSHGTSGYSNQVSATPSSSSSTAFLTGQVLGTARNNLFQTEGFQFTVGSTPITVTALGRWVISGNTGTHTLTLERASDNSVLGSVSVPTSGAPAGAVKYVTLGTAIPLAANTAYYVQSVETSGGDYCYDDDTTVTTTGVATVNDSIQGNVIDTVGAHSFGPLSFTYLTSGGSAPAAPTGLSATPGNAQVALSWTASTGATSYNVNRSTTSGSGYSTINSPTTTSYTDTSVTNGTTYYYVVTATNGNGTSGNSNQASATPSSGSNLVANGTYKVVADNSGLALSAASSSNGAAVTQQTYTGAATEQWTVTNLGSNVDELTVSGTSEALEVPGGSKTLSAATDISSYTGATYQQWTASSLSGFIQLTNVNSGLAANVNGGSTSPGATIIQWTLGNYTNEEWTFTAVSGGSGTAFVTGQTLGTDRNNFTGGVGFEFTTGSTAITVQGMGRWVVSGNTGAHTMTLVRVSDSAVLGSVSVPTSGATAGAFTYVNFGTPVALAASTAYYVMSAETSGGDHWYNSAGTALTTTSVATVNQAEYNNGSYGAGTTGSYSYVPVSFTYTGGGGGGGTTFVTGQTLGTLRNNYTSNVGFEFTVGSTAITIKSLGRWVVSGNTAAHSVWIKRVSDGADMGAATVNTSGATAGAFTYATASIPLAASTAYCVLSGETSGGDQWYNDNTTFTSTSAATINGSVDDQSGGILVIGTTGAHSYVPVSFTY